MTARKTSGLSERFRRFQHESAYKNGEDRKDPAFFIRKKIVTPVNGGAERLLPLRGVPERAHQELKPLAERFSMWAGGSIRTCAAASSTARGIPSSRVQMFSTLFDSANPAQIRHAHCERAPRTA